jgi:hypothetical protein
MRAEMQPIDRRSFLVSGGLALAGFAVACSKKPESAAPGTTINDVISRVQGTAGRFQVIQAVGEILARPDARVTFALVDAQGTNRYTGGSIQVYAGPDPDQPARGPIPAVYHGEGLGEKGVYVARINIDKPGAWLVLAVGKPAEATGNLYGGASYMVVDRITSPAQGAKAVSVPTPTVDDHRGVEPYCTRTDAANKAAPCSMHRLSLDVALANGKPTVFNIGTPRFCTSRTCGPVIDVIQTVADEYRDRVNFVHAEVYPDDRDAPAMQKLAPAPAAWALTEEPVTYWIRPDNTIVERFVGPADVSEVREVTKALVG